LKSNSSPTSNSTPGQILQTADGQLIILQSAEQQQQTQQTQYVQVGGQSKISLQQKHIFLIPFFTRFSSTIK